MTKAPQLLYRGNIPISAIKEVSTIASFSLAKNWNSKNKTDTLRNAVKKVVDANPILAGRLEERKKEAELVVLFDQFKADDLMKVVPTPSTDLPPLEGIEGKDLHLYLETYVIPHFPDHVSKTTRLVKDEIEDKTCLFEVLVMDLPNDHACYAVTMSHGIADGSIYYQVIEQLNEAMKCATGEKIQSHINWQASGDKCGDLLHHLIPSLVTYLGFMVGERVFKRFGPEVDDPELVLLSKEKLNQQKKLLVDGDTEYLTSNDIILAALSESMLHKAKIQTQYVNLRPRLEELETTDAGNWLATVHMGAKATSDPNIVRQVTRNGKYYNSPWAGMSNILRGKFARNTNWAGMKRVLDDTAVHMPAKSFVRSRYASAASSYFNTIFEYDNDNLGIMTNCKDVCNSNGLLMSIRAQ